MDNGPTTSLDPLQKKNTMEIKWQSCLCDSFAQQLHAASTSAADAPTLDHVGSHLDSSWSQLARARRKLGQAQVGPKWAPVRPNLRLRTAKFDPSRLWLGQVRPLPSSLSNSLGENLVCGSPAEHNVIVACNECEPVAN